MTTATTSGAARPQRKNSKAQRANASTPRAVTKSVVTSLPRADGRYAVLAGKSLVAAVFVFGVICAFIYTTTGPRRATQVVGERPKTIARQKTATTDKSGAEFAAIAARVGSALVSRIDLPVRDAPRRDAKVLARAVYGSRVEVVAQDGGWAQVRATGQNVAGWVEKAGLNF
jgi:hypothetical protein